MPRSYADRIRFANEEILGNGALDEVDNVFATDYVVHAGGKDYRGPQFVKRFVRQLRAAITDLRVVQVEILSQARGTLAWQRTLRGAHQSALRGIPPSGKKVEWRDLLVTRFDGEKIVEEWAVSELAAELMSKLPRKGP